MAQITWTYTTITAAAQKWLDDTDSDMDATTLAQAIQLGEQKCVEDLDLTIFDQTGTATLTYAATPTVTNATIARPANLLVTDEVSYTVKSGTKAGKVVFLERRDYSFVLDYLDPDPTTFGPPKYYAESDITNWVVAPYPDNVGGTTYTLTGHGPFAAQSLTDAGITPNTATWLSSNAGHLLWCAVVLQIAVFLKNQARQQEYGALYNSYLTSLRSRFRALRRNTLDVSTVQTVRKPEGQTPASKEA
jgi:hypothetical protein